MNIYPVVDRRPAVAKVRSVGFGYSEAESHTKSIRVIERLEEKIALLKKANYELSTQLRKKDGVYRPGGQKRLGGFCEM